MQTNNARERAAEESRQRAAFNAMARQIEDILLDAGWTHAEHGGRIVPFVAGHGDLVVIRGNDADGFNHSAAGYQGLTLAEYLAALDLRLRVPRPQSEPDPIPPVLEEVFPRPEEAIETKEVATSYVPLPDLSSKLIDWGAVGENVPPKLASEMLADETIGQAKKRLFPLLTQEKAKLKNQQALFGQTDPRLADVEYLLGILAQVSEM